jgi:hypothetical protein
MSGGSDYPVGQTWVFDIGIAEIESHFPAAGVMRYRILSGSKRGEEGSVDIDVRPVGPNQFFVSWQEADGSIVVHLEDYAQQRFHSCLIAPGSVLHRFSGSMRRL